MCVPCMELCFAEWMHLAIGVSSQYMCRSVLEGGISADRRVGQFLHSTTVWKKADGMMHGNHWGACSPLRERKIPRRCILAFLHQRITTGCTHACYEQSCHATEGGRIVAIIENQEVTYRVMCCSYLACQIDVYPSWLIHQPWLCDLQEHFLFQAGTYLACKCLKALASGVSIARRSGMVEASLFEVKSLPGCVKGPVLRCTAQTRNNPGPSPDQYRVLFYFCHVCQRATTSRPAPLSKNQ